MAADSSPSTSQSPISVVENRLAALQQDDVQSWWNFATPRVRRASTERQRFEKFVRAAPALKPLIGSDRYEILSALQVAPRRWRCRVRVENKVGSMRFSVEYTWELAQHVEAIIHFDLGQCIKHDKTGQSGVVVGWDTECTRSEEWCQAVNVDALPHGRAQPFYIVLTGRREAPYLYVAQDDIVQASLCTIEHPDFDRDFSGAADEATATWQPRPFLRQQYPRGLEGCWLVDHVIPDVPPSEHDA